MAMMAKLKATLRVGHSPDADDAFMFYAIAEGKIDTGGLKIHHVVEDIQSLNERAMRGELEVTAVSSFCFFHLTRRYTLLSCGASIGDNYGPIVVSRKLSYPKEIKGKRIAVPGKLTTAYLLLRLYETDFEPVFAPFDQVIGLLDQGAVDAALLIHEGQVTYPDQKLTKVIDLGEWFYEMARLPLPLGVDVVRSDLGPDVMRKIQKVLRESILYALDHRDGAMAYAMRYGRDTARDQLERFVSMYVNAFTVNMGKRGKEGLMHLFKSAKVSGLIRNGSRIEFVPK